MSGRCLEGANFLGPKFLGNQIVSAPKFFRDTKFSMTKIFWTQTFSGPKFFWVPKFFGTQIFQDVEFFWNTKFLVPNTFWYTKVLYPNFLLTKIFSRLQYFGTRNFFEPIILSIHVCFQTPTRLGTQPERT